MVGDVVGRVGRRTLSALLPDLVQQHEIDFTVVNGENSAGGIGITPKTARSLFEAGADCITTGNHVWAQRDIYEYLDQQPRVLRPANYPPGTPGKGVYVGTSRSGVEVCVINLQGRVFMDPLDCPFRGAEALLEELQPPPVRLVDFHAEATSEKLALGRHLDGQVTAVVGTHTHVQTADETILPAGTAYLSDLGMTGAVDSILGIKTDSSLKRFLTALPMRFEVPESGACVLCGLVIECDAESGRALAVERIQAPFASE
jgi:metallophosphoesterase (TIGR00282 family)